MTIDWNAVWSSIATSAVVVAILAFVGREFFKNLLSRGLEKQKSELQGELEAKKSELQKGVEETKSELLTQLEDTKASWTRELEKDKVSWQAAIQREVSDYLGERSAEREYVLEARKRLYTAVGPLRFQLLTACSQLASRINTYGLDALSGKVEYIMKGYYGESMMYRLLRPIAICELIERQIAFADFAVDPAGMDALRFKKAAYTSLTDGKPILDHPKANWENEKQHVFSGTLSTLAHKLIAKDSDFEKVIQFHDFQDRYHQQVFPLSMTPLDKIFANFSVSTKPLFWIRLVCIGYVCTDYVRRVGVPIGFSAPQFEVEKLVAGTGDPYFESRRELLLERFEELANIQL